MKKSELLQRIVELEARVKALEARPVGPVYVPAPSPSVPLYPWQVPYPQMPYVTCYEKQVNAAAGAGSILPITWTYM
jgi:hypothetical protein